MVIGNEGNHYIEEKKNLCSNCVMLKKSAKTCDHVTIMIRRMRMVMMLMMMMMMKMMRRMRMVRMLMMMTRLCWEQEHGRDKKAEAAWHVLLARQSRPDKPWDPSTNENKPHSHFGKFTPDVDLDDHGRSTLKHSQRQHGPNPFINFDKSIQQLREIHLWQTLTNPTIWEKFDKSITGSVSDKTRQ